MEALEQIFAKPFEITQFWASDKYLVSGQSAGQTEGHLYKYCPEHVKQHQPASRGDWFFEVCDGEGGPFAGDFLPQMLPTRANIALLNRACIKASQFLGATLAKGPIEGDIHDDQQLFRDIQAYSGRGPMEITNGDYCQELWRVLGDDWGLSLPEADRFGLDDVTIRYRPGLPCAAAMVRAVVPIMEAIMGDLQVVKQSTAAEGERVFDVMVYKDLRGNLLVQRFDITEIFGRSDLDWKYFHF